jgi:hypothetical protein
MPIEPPEVPPPTPGHPTEPPQESPPGNPRPEVLPPVREPGEPARPEELPGRTPDELPVRGPEGPRTPNPATDAGTADLPDQATVQNSGESAMHRGSGESAVRDERLNTQ